MIDTDVGPDARHLHQIALLEKKVAELETQLSVAQEHVWELGKNVLRVLSDADATEHNLRAQISELERENKARDDYESAP